MVFVFILWLFLTLGAGAQPAPVPATDPFAVGNRKYAAGDYAGALQEYRRLERSQAGNAFYWYNLGLAQRANGHLREACRAWQRASELDPAQAYTLVDPGAGLKSLNLLRQATDHELALALCSIDQRRAWKLAQQAADWDLEPARSSLVRARAAAALGRPGLAAHYYQQFLEDSFEWTGRTGDIAVWGPGRLATREGRSHSLVLSVSRSGLVRPLKWQLPARGHALQVLPEGALRVFTLDSEEEVGRLALDGWGRCLQGYQVNREAEVVEAWGYLKTRATGLLTLVQDSPFEDRLRRAAWLQALGPEYRDFAELRLTRLSLQAYAAAPSPEALGECHKHAQLALEACPDCDEAIYNMAAVESLEGHHQEAVERLLSLADYAPGARLPRRLALSLCRGQGATGTALALARQDRAAFPNDPYGAVTEAQLLAASGQSEAAGQLLDTILEQRPELVEALYLKARLLGRGGSISAQEEMLERIRRLEISPYRALRMLASLRDRMGKLDSALELYRLYLANGEARYREPEEFLRVFARYQELLPEHP